MFLYLAPTNNDAANRSVLNGGVRARSRPPGTENTVPTQGSMVLPELPTRPVSSGKNEYSVDPHLSEVIGIKDLASSK